MQGGYGACFCTHGTKIGELEQFRGTRLLRARNISPDTKAGCELERDRGIIKMRSVLGAEGQAKTVTNKWPLLTVLGEVAVIMKVVKEQDLSGCKNQVKVYRMR